MYVLVAPSVKEAVELLIEARVHEAELARTNEACNSETRHSVSHPDHFELTFACHRISCSPSFRIALFELPSLMLSRHLNPDKVLATSHEHSTKHQRKGLHNVLQREGERAQDSKVSDYTSKGLPRFQLPSKGVSDDTAYDLISSELALDGNPALNLASFVHTRSSPLATKLCYENINKNLIDSDEYPAMTLIHTRLISMMAHLWHAPEDKNATGTATTGSSEAIQLGGLAMKRLWQDRMRQQGKDEYRPGPNIVMGANAQVALEKFARYFDVEMRLVPVSEDTNYVMSPERAMDYVDENTIGVFVILGSTYTGAYEDVQGMAKALDDYEAKTGISIPIHVDAASGGFVAPFATPSHKWDFRIPRVVSINTSGHKFGQALVGVGVVVWRDKAHLPKDMVFELHYLGSVEYSFSLNFSRPGHPVIGLYYNLVKLGFEGYRECSLRNASNARLLARALENTQYYEVVSDLHKSIKGGSSSVASDNIEDYPPSLPVVAFKFSNQFKQQNPNVQQKSIQTLLRSRSWIVPNYELPPDVEDVEILRVVVRESMSEEMIERLVTDILEVTEDLMQESQDSSNVASNQRRAHERQQVGGAHGKSERDASKQGHEGVRPTGHDSVC
ncbi:glutamate decarboxylase gad1 [Microbotryomycetes sp. JL221]|nr:glutamate decarboxylase gad1 [Microbotryomycetes sp. JL221]